MSDRKLSQKDALRMYDKLREAHNTVKHIIYHDEAYEMNAKVKKAIEVVHSAMYAAEHILMTEMDI